MKLKEIFNNIPTDENTRKFFNEEFNQWFLEINGKQFSENVDLDYLIIQLKLIESQYGARARKAQESDCVDWKAYSHCFRVLEEAKQLFLENTITFPLVNAEFVKEIKEGKHSFDLLAPMLDNLLEEVEELKDKSKLPEAPDREYWENWLYEILKEYYKQKEK